MTDPIRPCRRCGIPRVFRFGEEPHLCAACRDRLQPERDTRWHACAACRDHPTPEDFYADNRDDGRQAVERALAVCRSCPVTVQCLAYALAEHDQHGVWGGMTAKQREAFRRQRVPRGKGPTPHVMPHDGAWFVVDDTGQQARFATREAALRFAHEFTQRQKGTA